VLVRPKFSCVFAAEREVEDIGALENEACGSAALFGNSSGARLSIEVAATLGQAITKLGVYEAPYVVDDSLTRSPMTCADQLAQLMAADRRGDAVELS
jgi:hypothetical protein